MSDSFFCDLFVTPVWNFQGKNTGVGLCFLTRIFANPGLKPMSPALTDGSLLSPLGKPKGGYIYIYVSIHIPSFTAGKRISWSFPPAFFSKSDDTHVLFLHGVFCHCQPAELHVCVIGFHGISLLGWQNSVAILLFPRNLNNAQGKNFPETKICCSLLMVDLINWRKKIVGLGTISVGRFLSAEGDRKEFKIVIRETRRTME